MFQKAYTPPRKYLDLMRKGGPAPNSGDGLKPLTRITDGFGDTRPGTDGLEYESDQALALRLTQILVQQGWDDARIQREHMKAKNRGFLWVRRQDDPEAALEALIARCDRTRRPRIPASDRHAKMLELLRTGEVVSQKAIIAYVGTNRDSDTRNDIEALEAAGAITVERVQHGTSAKSVWKRISIAGSVKHFWEVSVKIRRDVAKIMARKAKGCLGLSARKAAKPLTAPEDAIGDAQNKPRPGQYKKSPLSKAVLNWLNGKCVEIQSHIRAVGGNALHLALVRAYQEQDIDLASVRASTIFDIHTHRRDLSHAERVELMAYRLGESVGIDPDAYRLSSVLEPECRPLTLAEMESMLRGAVADVG